MNFLAHAYLSFQDREILAGNLISDFVKGKKKFDYASRIQQGISLHRSIDEFTDRHAATRNARNYFKAEYGLYSGAFIDIVYDHFLANDQQAFPNESDLAAFAQSTYQQLDPPGENFPEPFKFMFMHMKKQDWLYH
jgi:acyl carrier protein phosphodiesterase